MERVVELLIQGFDEIQSGLSNHISWFYDTLLRVENCLVFVQKHATSARDLLKYYGEDWSGLEMFLKKGEFLQRLTPVAD